MGTIMPNTNWYITASTIDFHIGTDVSDAIRAAIELSATSKTSWGSAPPISFNMNGVAVTVTADSNPELIYRDFMRATFGYIGQVVGPNPNPVLTDEEKANDSRMEAERERQRDERQAEYNAKASVKRSSVEQKLDSAPPMEVNDEAVWQSWRNNQQDEIGYGVAIFTYAESWARLMQMEMANGQRLEDIANATSQEADVEGITGAMYGVAVAVLASCWKYGDQLRRWHNLDTQISDEGEKANETGGTLNPAFLHVG